MRYLLVITLFLLSQAAFACNTDTECSDGGRCMHLPGMADGICKGGNNQGNDNGPVPSNDQGNQNAKNANTCAADNDCGNGLRCAKGRGQDQGVCVRKR